MDMKGLSGLEQQPKQKGLVHLYVGDGKGKTTSVVGLAVRMLGHGGAVLFCQFLKGRATSEIAPLERLGAQVRRAKSGSKFFFQLSEEEKKELCDSHCACIGEAAEDAASGKYNLIVLDEVVDAVNCGAVPLEALLSLLQNRAPGVEVAMTGRNPKPEIVDAADYHTELVCRKHPYQQGVPSRPGVEF